MEKFVVQEQSQHLSTSDVLATSPKKIKLEDDEKVKEDEEDGDSASSEFSHPVPWHKIEKEGLDLDYALLFSKEEANELFKQLEEEVVYTTGTTSTILIKHFHHMFSTADERLRLFYSRG